MLYHRLIDWTFLTESLSRISFIQVGNVMLVPQSVPKIWSLEVEAWSLKPGAYGSVLELGDAFWKFFLIFQQKKMLFFYAKKSATGRFWSLRVGLQDWYVSSKLQVRPKSPSSKTGLDLMGPYYLLTSTNRTEKCSWKEL